MNKPAISVENLSKMYRLGKIGYGTLRSDLSSWWAKIRGKEDPNVQIGKESRYGQRGEFWALRDVNFTIQKGERVGIIGRNGAGKSTLLKILSKITAPTEGYIKVNGRVTSLLEVGTGFHPELSGRENIFLNGAILGMKRAEIKANFDEIVDFAGISEFIDTPVKRYSSGMYVRLAFSVAAHLNSDILVVDEVLAVGDAEFQKKCIGKMENVSKDQGRTVLFVSHSITSINRLCETGILLNGGQVVEMGTIAKVIQTYNTSFPIISNGVIQTNDKYHLRTTDHFELKELRLLNTDDKVEIGFPIGIKFSVKLNEQVENLAIIIAIRDRLTTEFVTNAIHQIPAEKNKPGTIISGNISVDTDVFRPGLYPIYFWFGDLERRLIAGCPKLVADEVIGPILIERNANSKLNYQEPDDEMQFTIKSELKLGSK